VAFGPLPTGPNVGVNCAAASPDGRWIAVASDALSIALLPEALDYCHLAAARLDFAEPDNPWLHAW